MKLSLILALCMLPAGAFGQALSGINGDCQIGGQQALVSGLPSTATQQIGTTNVNPGAGVQASFPSCLVTVYATGTTNKANIYSNNTLTPTPLANSFLANVDGSFTFFVAAGCYDVVMSSGSGPALPYTRTLSGLCVGQGTVTIPGGSGTVGSCATVGAFAFYQVAGTTATCDQRFVTDGNGNATGISLTLTGPGAGFLGFTQGAAPPLTVANTAYLYSDTSVPITFGTALPTTPGTLNQVWGITQVVDATHIKTGWIGGSSGCLEGTCLVNAPSADQTITGAHALILSDPAATLKSPTILVDTLEPDTSTEGITVLSALDPTSNYVTGIEVDLTTTNAGNATDGGIGLYGNAISHGAGAITPSEVGVQGHVGIDTSHTLTAAYDFFAEEPTNSGGGTITNFYGMYFQNMGTGFTHAALVETAAQASASTWFLYGGTVKSLMGTIQFSSENGPMLDFGNGNPSASDANGSFYLDPSGDGAMWFRQNSIWIPIRHSAILFSAIQTCNSVSEGAQQAVTDSTTATWGATITGTGGNHVLAYCDGTNWTVAAQ